MRLLSFREKGWSAAGRTSSESRSDIHGSTEILRAGPRDFGEGRRGQSKKDSAEEREASLSRRVS